MALPKNNPNFTHIRSMQLEDVPYVYAIETATCPTPWSDSIFRDCVLVGYSCWVFELNNEIIGYGLMTVSEGTAHIVNITIHKNYHSQGFGRQLMHRLILEAKRTSCKSIILEVRVSNEVAINLYRSLGFVETGTREGYYEAPNNQREDALLMQLML